MATASTSFASTKETTNYARLCRLLVDVGSQVLRDTFDRIHPPGNLHTVLTSPAVQRKLNSLYTGKRKILNSTQWGLLYPLHSPPTSASFDIALVTVLLRNICGLTPPASGWDSLPAATDTNIADDIARVKYYRNTLYGHATKASIDDASFNAYWSEIRAALVRLGGVGYGAKIDSLKTDCMDPDCVKQYKLQLLEEWKKDDDKVKVKFEDLKDDINVNFEQMRTEMRTEMERMREKLDTDSRATTAEIKEEGQLQTDRSRLKAAIQHMKDNIKAGTEKPPDLQQPFRPHPGEGPEAKDLKIDQIYVNVVLHEGRVDYKFPTDRWEQLKVYPQPNTNKAMSVRPQDVIDAKYKNVLVVGRPGIGKTMMSTKLLRTWASDDDKMQAQFKVAFLLKFRYLNKETDLSLHELLARSDMVESLEGEVWKYIEENPSGVLLIFDGIDEFSARSALIANNDSSYKDTVEEKMPLHTLYRKLASGKLLPGATVITTTRPTAVQWIKYLNFHRTIEILGFTSEQVKEYVEKFTEDDHNDDAKDTIWQHIRSNLNIFSLCYIPVNCFIICHCLLQLINICTDTARKLPTKITDIYSMNVKIFFFKHNREDKYSCSKSDLGTYLYKKFDDLQPENELVFKRLGEMAFNGIKEGRLIFESSEVGELEDCGLLHRLADAKPRKLSEPPKAQFCFTHLTVQEFFAAKHLTNTLKKEDLRRFVADHINHGTWQVVMQFVAGLLEPDADRELSNIDIFADLLPTSRERYGSWNCWPAYNKHSALNVCKCLNEFDVEQKNSVLRKTAEIGFNGVDFSRFSLSPVDCTDIVRFLNNTKGLEYLNFSGNHIGSLGCREINDFLIAVNCHLTELDLSINNIGDRGIAYLCDALKHINCKLTTLNLSVNNIGEQSAAYLCDALKDVNCKLTTLYLGRNNIGKQGAAYLCDVLKDVNCKLTTLDLGINNIGEQSAEYLCDALKDVNCKLTTLHLSANNIGEQGAAYLCDALKDVNCKLTTLDISGNNIGEQGAAYLCDALKDVNCKLTTLNLSINNIGEQGAAYLYDVLKDVNCKLTTLDLTGNKIGYQLKAQLFDSLDDVNFEVWWD